MYTNKLSKHACKSQNTSQQRPRLGPGSGPPRSCPVPPPRRCCCRVFCCFPECFQIFVVYSCLGVPSRAYPGILSGALSGSMCAFVCMQENITLYPYHRPFWTGFEEVPKYQICIITSGSFWRVLTLEQDLKCIFTRLIAARKSTVLMNNSWWCVCVCLCVFVFLCFCVFVFLCACALGSN